MAFSIPQVWVERSTWERIQIQDNDIESMSVLLAARMLARFDLGKISETMNTPNVQESFLNRLAALAPKEFKTTTAQQKDVTLSYNDCPDGVATRDSKADGYGHGFINVHESLIGIIRSIMEY